MAIRVNTIGSFTMPYTIDLWKERVAKRTDLTTQLIHLTRKTDSMGSMSVLIKILREGVIKPSVNTSDRGFICGSTPATCFQDTPLYSLAQNIYAEEEYIKTNKDAKLRYNGIGLMLSKPFIYSLGGRPVIYEDRETAKSFLPAEEHWRIVNFQLNENENIVDWTHEREWRVPGEVEFPLSEATVVLQSPEAYKLFLEKAKQVSEVDILEKIRTIVTLGSVLY